MANWPCSPPHSLVAAEVASVWFLKEDIHAPPCLYNFAHMERVRFRGRYGCSLEASWSDDPRSRSAAAGFRWLYTHQITLSLSVFPSRECTPAGPSQKSKECMAFGSSQSPQSGGTIANRAQGATPARDRKRAKAASSKQQQAHKAPTGENKRGFELG